MQIDARCTQLREAKAKALSQSIEVAKQVAMARTAREAAEEEVLGINEGLGELPMVLGRSLNKVPGGLSELAARPNESYDLIRHELVFREVETQVAAAQKTHKGSLAAGTAQWGAEQHRINDETMLQMTLNKLAAVGDLVKIARSKDVSMDVVGAVDLFHIKKARLATVEHRCDGPVDWVASRVTTAGHRASNKKPRTKEKSKFELEDEAKAKAEAAAAAAAEEKSGQDGGNAEEAEVAAAELVTVIPWPSSDMLADDFVNHRGAFKPPPQKTEEASDGDDGTFHDRETRDGDGQEGGHGGGHGRHESGHCHASLEASLLPMPAVPATDAAWQGLTLRGDRTSGSVMGVVRLPRFDFFSVTIVVTKTRPLAVEQGHSGDTLTIKTGLDLRKLSVLAVVTNTPNDEGAYRHEVHYRVRGDSFAFCFEWMCEGVDPLLEHRLAVERGFFEL